MVHKEVFNLKISKGLKKAIQDRAKAVNLKPSTFARAVLVKHLKYKEPETKL
jgi:hypothetical protein